MVLKHPFCKKHTQYAAQTLETITKFGVFRIFAQTRLSSMRLLVRGQRYAEHFQHGALSCACNSPSRAHTGEGLCYRNLRGALHASQALIELAPLPISCSLLPPAHPLPPATRGCPRDVALRLHRLTQLLRFVYTLRHPANDNN